MNKSVQWCLRIAAAVGLVAVAFSLDEAVAGWIASTRVPNLTGLAAAISKGSDWPVLVAIACFGGVAAHYLKHVSWARMFFILGLAAAMSGLGGTTVRSLTGRTRPSADVQGFYGPWHKGECLIGKHKYNSFPSGHTSTAAGVFGALLAMGWRLGLAGFLFAASVGWSRMMLNCHHFSDTVAAMMVGLFGGWWVVNVLWPKLHRRLERRSQFVNSAPGDAAMPAPEVG